MINTYTMIIFIYNRHRYYYSAPVLPLAKNQLTLIISCRSTSPYELSLLDRFKQAMPILVLVVDYITMTIEWLEKNTNIIH